MNEKPKTKAVESVERLLSLFVQIFQVQSDKWIVARAVALEDGNAELHFAG